MKRFFPFVMIIVLAGSMTMGCKSSSGPIAGPTHGVDASGNVWMNPPPTGEGLQIAVVPFQVPDSGEVQGNFYLHIPSDIPFNVGRIEIAMNEGTHHMNLYRWKNYWSPDSGIARSVIYTHLNGKVDTVSVRYQAQFNAQIVRTNGDLMVEAQVPYLNWDFPILSEGPDAGSQTCVQFAANDTIVIENHYVNIPTIVGGAPQTTPNGMGKVIINLWKATGAPVVAAMMFARQKNLVIPPKSDYTASKDCKWDNEIGNAFWTQPLYLLGMTGHYHSRGKNFWVEKVQDVFDAGGNVTGDSVLQEIYRSASWSEPPFTPYATPIKLELSKGQFLRYHAEYVNTLSTQIIFGPYVATNEHMNLFVWFYSPAWTNGTTIYDDNP
jgi:hypothetical protein